MPAPVPAHFAKMQSIVGVKWDHHDGPNDTIGSWLKFIGKKYPNMKAYCESVLHMQYFSWCGLSVGYCMASADIAPVFGVGELNEFLWAKAWLNWGTAVNTPQLGDVIVFDFGGGDQHVTLFQSDSDNGFWACLGGNQSHQVKVTNFASESVIGIRRPPGAGLTVAQAGQTGADQADTESDDDFDDPDVPNKYPELDVIKYRKTTMSPVEIAQALAAMNIAINVKRAAYAIICNESAFGKAGINNNYAGFQADGGHWAHAFDPLLSGTCVLVDSGGSKRRFLCFNTAAGCFEMMASIVQKRGLYVGGTTNFVTHTNVATPADWALAYYREWVTGDANAELSSQSLHSLASLYQAAVDALP